MLAAAEMLELLSPEGRSHWGALTTCAACLGLRRFRGLEKLCERGLLALRSLSFLLTSIVLQRRPSLHFPPVNIQSFEVFMDIRSIIAR